MKKLTLTVVAALFALVAFCQNDIMFKHSGEKIECKVVSVTELNITYKYPKEDAVQTIGKFAVASITYAGSGRKETISEKITVATEDDWEKVQVLTDKTQMLGLKKRDEIKGKTAGISYNTAGSADKKADRRLRKLAAAMGAPFVLLTEDKDDHFGAKQTIKKGIAFSY